MHPHTFVHLWAAVGAAGAAALWLGLRCTLLVDFAGWGGPGTEEVIVSLLVGYILGGLIANARETLANQADQTEALAEVSRQLGWAFFPGSLFSGAGGSLLRHYSSPRNRMAGLFEGASVEMLDVERQIVQHTGDGGTHSFDWRRTIVVFLDRTDLPDLYLLPRKAGSGISGDLAGAELITLASSSETVEAGLPEKFCKQYTLGFGRRPGNLEAVLRIFGPDALAFFVRHPGWNVEIAEGQVAVWREDRVVPASRRIEFLGEAGKVYRTFLEGPKVLDESLTVRTYLAPDFEVVKNRFFGMCFRWFIGLFLGGLLGMAMWSAGIALIPQPWPGLLMGLFALPTMAGMIAGVVLGLRFLFAPIETGKDRSIGQEAPDSDR